MRHPRRRRRVVLEVHGLRITSTAAGAGRCVHDRRHCGEHAWGIGPDASITCWGYLDCGPTNLPALAPNTQPSNALSVAGPAIGSLGDVTYAPVTSPAPCNNDVGELEPPAGRYSAVAIGYRYSCGLKETGTILCWGLYQLPRSGGEFRALAVGANYACAVRTDHTIHCWGDNDEGQTEAPSGEFTSITAGERHSCALSRVGTVACWGDNRQGQTEAPSGEFASITAGKWHSCGLRPTGIVECWGANDFDAADPPAGRFADVSAGQQYSCGIHTDGSLECWDLHARTLADIPENVPLGARA